MPVADATPYALGRADRSHLPRTRLARERGGLDARPAAAPHVVCDSL